MVFDERYLSLEDGEYGYFCEYFPQNKTFYDERTQEFILGFKNGKEDCINMVFNQLYPQLGDEFAIAVVPSSSVDKHLNSSCHVLAGKILDKATKEGKYMVDAQSILGVMTMNLRKAVDLRVMERNGEMEQIIEAITPYIAA